ncbi:MAG: potassium transporter [Lentisphaerae bacterium]|nr:potassium transporter [Lentisphaerota bacterium]
MAVNVIKKSQFYMIFSFLGLILVGTLLLKSPLVQHNNGGLDWLNALFTATSAVCVVGLTSIPTDGFNWVGQLVIMLLIQGGGLGMVTITASAVLMIGRDFSWGGKKVLASISEDFPISSINEMIKTVVGYTFFMELSGLILLLPGFLSYDLSFGEALRQSLFHTISAYCNAGFSTLSNNFIIEDSSYIKMVMTALIIAGGLGFYVIYDILHHERNKHYQINTKIVLATTFLLLFAGTLSIKGLEWLGTHHNISWLDAFFQSTVCRSAGFNSVNLTALNSSTQFILVLLMMVGASPNSTGGGMKTTTFALVLLSIWNSIRGKNRVVVFGREIAQEYCVKAFAIMMIYISIVIIGSIFVCATVEASGFTLKQIGFEVVSALTTTGLSLGYSGGAGTYGKTALIICMFIGRIGPFAIFMFFISKNRQSHLSYPEEHIILT